MSDPTFVTYNIAPIAGTTASTSDAAVTIIDDRFQQAENALNDLSARVEELNTKSAIIRQHVPLADDMFVGALVYYNESTARFDRALAVTLAETTEGGQSIEAPSARVEGIVIATDAGSSPLTGTILMGGYWNDDTVMSNCLTGTDTGSGTYYLSPTIAGKATKETYGHLSQPVLTYYGEHAGFSMTLFYQAHDNHYHASQVLTAGWEAVTGSTIQIAGTTNYVNVPTGAQWYYTGSYAQGLGTLGPTTAVFDNGILQNTWSDSQPYKIANNALWKMDNVQPGAGDVTIFNHYPFAYDATVIRSISSSDDAITVTTVNGNVTITGNDFVDGSVLKSSYAVSGINGKELNFTPVVTDVLAGPGLSMTRALDGSVYLSAADKIGCPMDAYSINHNGTTLVSNGILQFITFPALRLSSYVMTMPVTDINTPCKVSVWWMKLGTTTPSLFVTAKFIQDPAANAPTSTSVTGYTGTINTTAGADTDSLVYNELAIDGCTVSGSGMLVAIVSSTVSTQAQFLRTGFKLDVINANANMAQYDNASITQTMQKGSTPISVGQAVMVTSYNNSPCLVPCTNERGALGNNANRCVGVAITGSTSTQAGDNITYMITGTMTHTISGATAGQSLFIGVDGMLTPVADSTTFLTTAQFLQKVGTVLSGNKIQVNIESAIEGA